jgi:prepilin-type N-terminal cleavage/methylation domain-containing protein
MVCGFRSPLSRARRPVCAANGFTLVEMVISAAILGTVLGGVTLCMSTSLDAWRRGQERAELQQEGQATMELIAQDLCRAFVKVSPGTGGVGFFKSQDGEVEGKDADSLDFTTISARRQRQLWLAEQLGTKPQMLVGACRVRYYLEPGENGFLRLYRQESTPAPSWSWEALIASSGPLPPAQEPDPSAWKPELLSERVESFNLRFYDGQEWLDEWDELEQLLQSPPQGPLPQAIQFQIAQVELSVGAQPPEGTGAAPFTMRFRTAVTPAIPPAPSQVQATGGPG